jgi:hypothetical protein
MPEITKAAFTFAKNSLGIYAKPTSSVEVTISGSIIPVQSSSFDLGVSNKAWRNLYVVNVLGTSSYSQTASYWDSSSVSASISLLQGDKQNNIATGSLVPWTASWAITSSFAITSSWAESASWAPSVPSDIATSASFASASISASYAGTASVLLGNISSANIAISASWASASISASYAGTASVLLGSISSADIATSASFASASISSSYAITSSWAISASWAPAPAATTGTMVTGSSYPITASWAESSSWAPAPAATTGTMVTGSSYPITASWAESSSWAPSTPSDIAVSASFASASISSSYTVTSSFAISASWAPGGDGVTPGGSYNISASWASASISASYLAVYQPYENLVTNSINWITASFTSPNSRVVFQTTASYSFTSSNHPAVGTTQFADIVLFITNSSVGSSSLVFPTNWINIAGSWPTTISASRAAVLWLRAFDDYTVIGSYTGTSASVEGTGVVDGGSYDISASWASASISSSYAVSASWAPGGDTGPAVSASWASASISASYSNTASYVLNQPITKAGLISGSTFVGNPKTASIAFITEFPTDLYAITVASDVNSGWSIQNRTATGFELNTNSNTVLTGIVYWTATQQGEYIG